MSVIAQRHASVIAVMLLVVGLLATSFATAPPAEARVTSPELQMVRYMNAARRHYGRRPLRVSSSMSDIARRHSVAMARRGRIYHTRDLGYTLRRYSWQIAGENVGTGGSVYSIYRAFWRSKSHRANILYRSYRYTGVGIVRSRGSLWVTVMFIG